MFYTESDSKNSEYKSKYKCEFRKENKMKDKYKVLYDPIKIGKLEIKNRYVLAPMGPGGMCNADGSLMKEELSFM